MTLLRLEQVKTTFGYKSHSSIYNLIRDGLFPTPIKIGIRSVGWLDTEVNGICAARVAGVTEERIKRLVKELEDRRMTAFDDLGGSK